MLTKIAVWMLFSLAVVLVAVAIGSVFYRNWTAVAVCVPWSILCLIFANRGAGELERYEAEEERHHWRG